MRLDIKMLDRINQLLNEVTAQELLNYIREEDNKDASTGRQDSTMA